jgi:uncharacterized CHY-type Zn-finger protein
MQNSSVVQSLDPNHAVGSPVTSAAHSIGLVQPPTRLAVARPTSKAQIENPREFQIGQIKRRFSPEVKDDIQGTSLTFQLNPSDPDFPFELDGLKCTLVVPTGFPGTGRPALKVRNAEMERGYQINVERGFDALIDRFPQKSLLGLMNELDKNLEKFLTAEKAQTIKIVANAPRTVGTQMPGVTPEVPPKPTLIAQPVRFTPSQKEEASAKRESDIRQLEARMGRQPLFSKSADGTSFNIPLQVAKPSRLPLPLQSLRDITLLVPFMYNLEPCTVILNGVQSHESELVEASFERRARQKPELSLMAHVNYLAQNMHLMVQEAPKSPQQVPRTADASDVPILSAPTAAAAAAAASSVPETGPTEDEKSHIKVIPRPPEWAMPDEHSEDDESSDTYDSDEELSDDEEGGTVVPDDPVRGVPQAGVLLSFPYLELYGIEVLKLASVSITVKCDRCKTVADITNIQPKKGESAVPKIESCQKCTNGMSASYRGELMHANSVRAGFLDLDGCTIVDLLPSRFIPTCSECSADYAAPGLVSVRGDTTMSMCRECHHKMYFKIPDVKFLRVSSAGADRPDRPLPRKKAKENLGIVAGQELPRRGCCRHYSKSYRWFRFSCCYKVYACDRCHDAEAEHPNEHANRMICGFCSREQAYRPEDCQFCHSVLVGKKGGGFWEGGKGMRDKVRMSRKDPRKYKRRGGGAVAGGTAKAKGK